MYYKAPDNSLHSVEPEFAHLLPVGSVPIGDDEAEALRLANLPKPTVWDQIIELERSVTPRRIREAVLGADNGWLAQVDAKIAELRGQL